MPQAKFRVQQRGKGGTWRTVYVHSYVAGNYGLLKTEQEARALLAFVVLQRPYEARIVRGAEVLELWRRGAAVPIQPTLQQRIERLEATVFIGEQMR